MNQEDFDKDFAALLQKHHIPFAFVVVSDDRDLDCFGYADEDVAAQAGMDALCQWFTTEEAIVTALVNKAMQKVDEQEKSSVQDQPKD